jgi:hypothetical protein
MPREYERFPRPQGPYYETRFPFLSQGDLFDDIPFGILGPDLLFTEDLPGLILQPVVFHRAMIVSPTCDFRRPPASALLADLSLDPYSLQDHVIVAPVFPLHVVAERWDAHRSNNTSLARRFDALRRYMYLPSLPDEDDTQEWLVDLSRTDTLALRFLAGQVHRRLTQLTFEAAQQLQYKLVMAMTAVVSDRAAYRPAMD